MHRIHVRHSPALLVAALGVSLWSAAHAQEAERLPVPPPVAKTSPRAAVPTQASVPSLPASTPGKKAGQQKPKQPANTLPAEQVKRVHVPPLEAGTVRVALPQPERPRPAPLVEPGSIASSVEGPRPGHQRNDPGVVDSEAVTPSSGSSARVGPRSDDGGRHQPTPPVPSGSDVAPRTVQLTPGESPPSEPEVPQAEPRPAGTDLSPGDGTPNHEDVPAESETGPAVRQTPAHVPADRPSASSLRRHDLGADAMRQRALNAAGLRSAENDGMHVYLAGIPSHQERGELAQRDSLISDLQAMRQVACPAARLAVPAQCQQAPPCGQAPAQGGPFTAHISNDVTAAPPAEEKILVKHVYSECNEDGFWHVVEDTWYDAGGGRIYKRRTYDQKTDQPCRDGDGRSVPESPKVRQLVSREIAPQEFGEAVEDGLIVEVRCENGLWYRYTFKRYRLKDGSYRRHHTPERVEGTGKRCDEPMPSPVGGSVIIIDAPPLEGTDAARRAPLKIGPATGDSSRRLTPYAQ